jgi:hypothetical protein
MEEKKRNQNPKRFLPFISTIAVLNGKDIFRFKIKRCKFRVAPILSADRLSLEVKFAPNDKTCQTSEM